jgi:magnesium-transporting ATPase (P-type)
MLYLFKRTIHVFLVTNIKQHRMISNFTVLTVPQWAIFAGITVMIYGWAEKKRIFGIVGSAIFAALGLFAAYAIFAGLMVPESMLDISENLPKDELFSPDELPIEGRLLPFYWVLVVNAVLALAAMFAEIFHKRMTNPLKIITGVVAIVVFFLMMGAVRH